jgi:hypothetical protein
LTQRSPSNNSHKISRRFSLANAFISVAARSVLIRGGFIRFTTGYRRSCGSLDRANRRAEAKRTATSGMGESHLRFAFARG